MKKKIGALGPALITLAALLYLLPRFSATVDVYPPEQDVAAEEEQGPSPEDWMYRQRAYPHGQIRKDIYLQAMHQWQALQHARSNSEKTWTPAGPENVGGRISSLAVHPQDPNTIYIGAASGGIFKTTDGGLGWQPVFDQAASLSIGDLALAPSNPETIYVGTGEANAGGGSLAYDGAGIYKSTDGGLNWSALGLENTGSTGKLLVHPSDADIAYAATMGSLFANNRERGLYRTTDGGSHWEQILYISDSTGVVDLAIHPDDPEILFAAAWERVRRPDRRQYSGPTSGIYRSEDGGDHWTRLSLPVSPTASVGRIGLAISPVNPNRIYAAVANDLLLGIYQSDDLGESWTALPLNGITQVSFMWWFGKIYADPMDADLVYFCGLELYRYQTGSTSWQAIMAGAHVDQHALYIEPSARNFMLLGNDGGLYYGTGNFAAPQKHFDNLPITQFYTAEVDYLHPERLFGGTQDNGVQRKDPATGLWQQILGGDGFVVLVDPTDSRFMYAASQYGALRRSNTGWSGTLNGAPNQSASEIKNWHTPVILDPVQPATLYYGAQRVHRSTNRALNWQPISPMLVRPPAGSNLAYGTLTSLAVSAADPQIIYAGGDEGSVFVSKDNGAGWENISAGLPDRWVTRIAAHPTDPAVAYVTFSGYRWDEYLPHVFRTDDNAVHWTDISAGLPEVPVNDLVINPEQPQQLFLATDAGVFISEDEGQYWEVLGQGLPKVVVNDLTYHQPSRQLLAATFGRSMYSLDLTDDPLLDESRAIAAEIRLKAFPNPFRGQTQIRLQLETAGEVRIGIFDLGGRLVRQVYEGHLPAGASGFEFQAPGKGAYVCRVMTRYGTETNRPLQKQLLLTAL